MKKKRECKETPFERFFQKVDKNGPIPIRATELGPCWIWTGSKRKTGHGYFWFDGRVDSAYRFSFMFLGIEIPDGCEVMHKCDNPPCVNPAHLEAGTHGQNIRDAVTRGLIPTGTKCSWTILTEDQVREIREKCANKSETIKSLAGRLGVSTSAVGAISRGKRWKHFV